MVCQIDNIPRNTPHLQTECGGMFSGILSVPHNTIIDLNNVMKFEVENQP